jgi:diaminohydroxyphosphoribosylaminopyrimidine deaminase/5-amino-6-(5-phosphoribosylamino)uracil reductase
LTLYNFCLEQNDVYMQRCLQLAGLGEGAVAPNPMVGAVLVHDGAVIGEGYHKRFGVAHAEVACLQSVRPAHQHLIAQATLYVSLEPCAHFGKTPPCADLIIHHKIPRVVVGCADPFGLVAGKGIQKLRDAGTDVTVGVLEKECRTLNKRFVLLQAEQRPYILLKWAQTADGKIGGENYKRVSVSNAYTNRIVHRWRSQNMAILVGTNTALFDDPELTTRLWPGKNAIRCVLDKTLRLPASLKLFDGQHQTVVFNHVKQQEHLNLLYCRLNSDAAIVQAIVAALAELKIQSVMIEGGAQLLQSFINAGLWDEANIITNQEMSLGKGVAAPQLQQHRLMQTERIFSDVIHTYVHETNTLA